MSAAELARGKWPSILMALGVAEVYLQNRHGPCPFCGGKDRYRFDDKDGNGGYYCNGCGAGSGFDLLMKLHGWDFARAAAEVERVSGVCEPKPARSTNPLKRLRSIQARAGATGEAVSQYLMNRGLSTVAPGLMQGDVDYYESGEKIATYPSMLGKVVSVAGKPLTWHVTYLHEGRKAPVDCPRKIMKAVESINGAAIRLYPLAAHIGIAEGIETAIAATELTGIPTWSVLNASGMTKFQFPESVERLTIFADHDSNYAGQSAAYALANRLAIKGVPVDVRVPEETGDWLDVLTKQSATSGAN